MSFFEKAGTMAIGSRLRILGERLMEDAKEVYDFYGVGLKPKWFPVFYTLSQNKEMSITAIAEEIGHSHPSVSKIVREMSKNGIVKEQKDKSDGRKNNIMLTEKGVEMTFEVKDQYTDVRNAVEDALSQTQHDIWKALNEFEFLLDQKSMRTRVLEQRKIRESEKVKIVSYEPKYQKAFKSLNEEWITTYFKMEEEDLKALDHPEEYILDKGGYICMALYENEVIGTCALIKMNDPKYDFELAKMGVSPNAKGKGIGWLLGKEVINKAKELGGSMLYLESNTVLTPAINLYYKLGFKRVKGNPSPYERCNIKMELELN
ncbi:helix-turn-helix domain-containing GNAT family N-acetyltransferase [Aquimarina sp. 2201CG5-10]|uniref:bifunctional helix-turn-helix transcriptional regulator/GNAT family N-acetyltransferase n=1 Tax=Aquimarina callyspongiae TaxID=3098150 RepID=UPI002AB35B65|nr:helix-turn-helix domain-containing GNAT family N-acetyltransferase [Aquimarina sp. 2201CG5-10]MDY8134802.1 helix-turn-helix domain-containing GNAT family N-acetyltransferase [Aquimarina sp. 2201CG5-10]